MAAVRQNGCALHYMKGPCIQEHVAFDVQMAAVSQDGYALRWCRRPYSKEIALEAVKDYGYMLSYMSSEFKDNEEVVLAAVSQDGRALQFASLELKNNKVVVMAALKQNARALEYVSDTLRLDKQVTMCVSNQIKQLRQENALLRNNPSRQTVTIFNLDSGNEEIVLRPPSLSSSSSSKRKRSVEQVTEEIHKKTKVKVEVMNEILNDSKEATERAEDALLCIICMESKRSIFLLPCAHLNLCQSCADSVQSCPTCRKDIDRRIFSYLS